MSPDEFDQQLHDAEVKLARLRALYEQYFQGIEKLEPHVARKEMDRTMEFLKKNLPRNTAMRFRTQQLSARYGTYITYWQRIGRQIEEGTFKRDVLRAQRGRGRARPKSIAPEPSGWEIEVDVDAVEEAAVGVAPDRHDDVDAILGALENKKLVSPPPPAATSGAVGAPKPPVRAGLTAFAKPAAKGLTAFGPMAPKRTDNSPSPKPLPADPHGPTPPTAPTANAAVPRPAPVRPTTAAVPKPPAAPVALAAPAPPVTATVAKPAAPAPPPAQASVGLPGKPLVPRPAATVPTPQIAASPGPAPAATRVAATFARPQGAAAPVVAPARAEPAAPAHAEPAAPPRAEPVAPPRAAPVADNGLQSLYERYAEARKKNNEGAVRFETLKDSVEKMLPKLREKHGDKKVDFEVVVQNGRVGLKPKVSE